MHLVGFIIRIYHDAQSSECQNPVGRYVGEKHILSLSPKDGARSSLFVV